MTALQVDSPAPHRTHRSPAVWLALLGSAFLLVNVVRALTAPASFAEYLGVPLASQLDDAWVIIYASRTLLLAIIILVLLYRRLFGVLGAVFAVSVIIPLTDAFLTRDAGTATVGRHLGIALYLLVTGIALLRTASRDKAR